jgi:uncharacterized protein
MSITWTQTAQGIVLPVHLQPRASRNCLVGLRGESLKITLTAPPVDGAANDALLTFLANLLRVPRSSLSLLTGGKSRDKRVLVRTGDPGAVTRRLTHHLAEVDKVQRDD